MRYVFQNNDKFHRSGCVSSTGDCHSKIFRNEEIILTHTILKVLDSLLKHIVGSVVC
jgi:hypothetical protein